MDTKKAHSEITNLQTLPAPDWREEFLEDYHHCCLCGTELYFTHVTHFADQMTVEEAFCECCRVRVKKTEHKLQ